MSVSPWLEEAKLALPDESSPFAAGGPHPALVRRCRLKPAQPVLKLPGSSVPVPETGNVTTAFNFCF